MRWRCNNFILVPEDLSATLGWVPEFQLVHVFGCWLRIRVSLRGLLQNSFFKIGACWRLFDKEGKGKGRKYASEYSHLYNGIADRPWMVTKEVSEHIKSGFKPFLIEKRSSSSKGWRIAIRCQHKSCTPCESDVQASEVLPTCPCKRPHFVTTNKKFRDTTTV